MAKRLTLVLGLVLAGSFIAVRAQQYPFWEVLLHSYGGTTDQTPVPTTKMGNHMQMSLKRELQPGGRTTRAGNHRCRASSDYRIRERRQCGS